MMDIDNVKEGAEQAPEDFQSKRNQEFHMELADIADAVDHPKPPEIIESVPKFSAAASEADKGPTYEDQTVAERLAEIRSKFPIGMRVAVERNRYDEEGQIIKGGQKPMDYDWTVVDPELYRGKLGVRPDDVIVARDVTDADPLGKWKNPTAEQLDAMQPTFEPGQEISIPLADFPPNSLFGPTYIAGTYDEGRVVVMRNNLNDKDVVQLHNYSPAELFAQLQASSQSEQEAPARTKKGFIDKLRRKKR